ncbi:MAG: hypothetical protein QOJ65_1546 [Fimbriimonadaceae bacterium]|jgi:hypothetical protein|nr:hypothetical protein [Fimbriimonadaceae bacterium]
MTPAVRVSIEGNGYLQFVKDGRALYASSASLTVTDGWISNSEGATLLPTLRVPNGTTAIEVDPKGYVFASTSSYRAQVGRIYLAVFRAYDDLRPVGPYLVSSALPGFHAAGEPGVGEFRILKSDEAIPATPQPVVGPSPVSTFVNDWVNRPEVARTEAALTRSVPTGNATVTIVEAAETTADRYTLGEIASVEADSELRQALIATEIGNTPGLGRKRKLRKDDILKALKSAGFDTSSITIEAPKQANIQRRAQQVSEDGITAAALEAAGQIYGPDTAMKARVKVRDAQLPVGDVAFEAESCIPTKSGASVIVVTKVNGERFNSHIVRISVDDSAAVQRALALSR